MPKSELREQLKQGFKELTQKAGELTSAAADFLEEQAVIGKLKFDILSLQRKIDRNLKEIGGMVLTISRATKPINPLENKEIKQWVKEIGDIEKSIASKRAEITKVTEASRQRRTTSSAPSASKQTVVSPKPTAGTPKSKPVAKPKPTSKSAPKPKVSTSKS